MTLHYFSEQAPNRKTSHGSFLVVIDSLKAYSDPPLKLIPGLGDFPRYSLFD
jgi:hypothetical protein